MPALQAHADADSALAHRAAPAKLTPVAASAAPTPARRGRPPRTARAAGLDTRQHLLRSGVALLTEKGYSAIGLDELLHSAQVTKGSFYHCFDGKAAFGEAVIDAYAGYFAAKLDRWFQDESLPPLQRLQAFMADAEAGMARHGFARGCLVGNLGQEMGALPEPFRQRLVDVFADWQRRTADCLQAAHGAGQLPADADPVALAEFFWIGWEGAVLRAKLERSGEPLRRFGQGFMRLLTTNATPAPND